MQRQHGAAVGCGAGSHALATVSDADVVFPQGYFEHLGALAEDDVIYGPKLSTDQFKHYYRSFAYGQAFFLSPPDPFGQWLQSVNSPGGLDARWRL